jgi:hypothetical protein
MRVRAVLRAERIRRAHMRSPIAATSRPRTLVSSAPQKAFPGEFANAGAPNLHKAVGR